MKALKLSAVLLTILLVGIFADVSNKSDAARAAYRANHPPTAEEQTAKTINSALFGCRKLTADRSPVTMGEVVREYEVVGPAGKPKVQPPLYRVGLEYRGGSDGRLMHATCEYKQDGDSLIAMRFSAQ